MPINSCMVRTHSAFSEIFPRKPLCMPHRSCHCCLSRLPNVVLKMLSRHLGAILVLFTPRDLDLFFFDIFPRLSQLHIVHYNAEKYASLSSAVDKSDGLAVLGVLFEVRLWTRSMTMICEFL